MSERKKRDTPWSSLAILSFFFCFFVSRVRESWRSARVMKRDEEARAAAALVSHLLQSSDVTRHFWNELDATGRVASGLEMTFESSPFSFLLPFLLASTDLPAGS